MAKKAAWSTIVEDEEAEENAVALPAQPATYKVRAAIPVEAFPSLGDAVKVVETKAEKRKKATKMSLADFNR